MGLMVKKVSVSSLQHLFLKNYKLNRGTKVPFQHYWVNFKSELKSPNINEVRKRHSRTCEERRGLFIATCEGKTKSHDDKKSQRYVTRPKKRINSPKAELNALCIRYIKLHAQCVTWAYDTLVTVVCLQHETCASDIRRFPVT